MQDEIVDKIKKAQGWVSSRYEIDQQLIEAGHDPADIDAAWNHLNQRTKPTKRRLSFKWAKAATLWLIVVNLAIATLAGSVFDWIVYYPLRLISGFAVVCMLVATIVGVQLLRKLKNTLSQSLSAIMITMWCLIFFFSLYSISFEGSWKQTEQLTTNVGNYYLVEKRDMLDLKYSLEIHRCQFANIWCYRVKNWYYYDGSYNGYDSAERINLLMKESKRENGSNV
jgi:hypothetical protein